MQVRSRASSVAPGSAADDALLLAFLRDRDQPCPLCRYNLRNASSCRCPECGQRLQLSLSTTDADVKPWLLLATCVCGSAGMGFIFIGLLARAGLPNRSRWLDADVIYFVCTLPTPLLLYGTRRRFQRAPRAVQWMIAGASAAVTLAAMLLMFATVR